jgi:hypothetical protein
MDPLDASEKNEPANTDSAAIDSAAIDSANQNPAETLGVAASPYRGCPPPTPEESRQRWAAWHQAMELSHEMLLMGLRQRIGPEGDLQAAYREWYERYQALKWDTKRAT